MRVYEFAKERGLQTKELLKILNDGGFPLSSHMAIINEDALAFLEKKLKKEPEVKLEKKKLEEKIVEKKEPIKKEEEAPLKKEPEKEKKVHIAPIPSKINPVEKSFPISKEEPQKEIEIPLISMTLSELADKMKKTASELILTLLKWGIISNKNQLLPIDLIARIAEHYQIKIVKPVAEKAKEEVTKKEEVTTGKDLKERMPIVVVMGHVDHGKTTLLDYIRKTRVAAKEKGGITQHLGAYEAKTSHGNVVFIDTPGHEAFSKIRIRGTKVADIAILVVAADDGIMPQTIEAIKVTQSMNVLVIVAINKIDKVDKTRVDVVKRDLATQFHLLPEEWGGQTVYVPISAKNGTGVDKLLDMITLQAQIMDLKADVHGEAKGFVLESKLEKGRGPVATLITNQGTLKIGDYFLCGKTTGRVSSMIDSSGARINEVYPSKPVQVAGLSQLPDAGDMFMVVPKEVYLKAKQAHGEQKLPAALKAIGVENAIKIIIKTDSNSSKEALLESVEKISKKSEKGFLIVLSGIGDISESDIMLASDTNSRIFTLHVKAEPNALQLATRMGVAIESFDIIYKLLERLQEIEQGMKAVKMVKTKVGEAIVRKVFDIKNLGVIAGSYVKDGIISRDGSVIIYRGTRKVGEGKISSLQREKHSIKEAHAGYECAFMVDNFTEWQIDDRVECYLEKPVK
jgi:translation initiation factor IF-2